MRQKLKADYYMGILGALLMLTIDAGPLVWMRFKPANLSSIVYFAHDLIVNKVLHGPVGYIGGLLAVVFAITQITKSRMLAFIWFVVGMKVLLPLMMS